MRYLVWEEGEDKATGIIIAAGNMSDACAEWAAKYDEAKDYSIARGENFSVRVAVDGVSTDSVRFVITGDISTYYQARTW